MRKIIYIIIFIVICSMNLFSKTLLVTKKVAKVGNEIILQSDVKKLAEQNDITYEYAKKHLINRAILYIGATAYAEEPSEKEMSKKIEEDKMMIASEFGIKKSDFTDEDFKRYLNFNKMTYPTYKAEMKKDLWIQKYLYLEYSKENVTSEFISDEEAKKYVNENPDKFREGEGVYLSMIYFSFYKENGEFKSDTLLRLLNEDSKKCLKKLINGADFEEMVAIYSNDLVSKNENPKGKIGKILFDDRRFVKSLSEEIVESIKKSDIGLIKKVFETKNGLYIFKIDGKIPSKKFPEKAAVIKAKYILEQEIKDNKLDQLKTKLIDKISQQIEIVLY